MKDFYLGLYEFPESIAMQMNQSTKNWICFQIG